MSQECLGIGGSPGKDVTVKASLLNKEPTKYVYDNGLSLSYQLGIDDSLYGGKDVVFMGNIGLPIPCDDVFIHTPPIWEVKLLTNEDKFSLMSNSLGEAWLYVSIDSGVGGKTKVYITDVEVVINET